MSCSTLSSAIAFSLGVVVGNSEGNCVGDGAASVIVDRFCVGVRSSSLSYSLIIVGIDSYLDVVLLMLGDGI